MTPTRSATTARTIRHRRSIGSRRRGTRAGRGPPRSRTRNNRRRVLEVAVHDAHPATACRPESLHDRAGETTARRPGSRCSSASSTSASSRRASSAITAGVVSSLSSTKTTSARDPRERAAQVVEQLRDVRRFVARRHQHRETDRFVSLAAFVGAQRDAGRRRGHVQRQRWRSRPCRPSPRRVRRKAGPTPLARARPL